jgi:hypothetical protein
VWSVRRYSLQVEVSVGELIDLAHERWKRAPLCPACGCLPPAPPDPDQAWKATVDVLLCFDDSEAGFTQDAEADPRLLGDPGLDG